MGKYNDKLTRVRCLPVKVINSLDVATLERLIRRDSKHVVLNELLAAPRRAMLSLAYNELPTVHFNAMMPVKSKCLLVDFE